MLVVNPMNVPVLVLIAPFVLLAVAFYTTVRWVLQRTNLVSQTSQARQRVISLVVAVTAISGLGLQSIGQLSPRDLFVLVTLALIAYFYIDRNALG